jgi:hypothetical protein
LNQVDHDGKSSLSNTVLVTNYNLKELKVESVYPNPFVRAFGILFNKELKSEANISIYTLLQGRKVFEKRFSEGTKEIFLGNADADFSPGVYLLKIESGGNTFTQRIVKQ